MVVLKSGAAKKEPHLQDGAQAHPAAQRGTAAFPIQAHRNTCVYNGRAFSLVQALTPSCDVRRATWYLNPQPADNSASSYALNTVHQLQYCARSTRQCISCEVCVQDYTNC